MKNLLLRGAGWRDNVAYVQRMLSVSQTSARMAQEWLKPLAVFLLFFTLATGQMWGETDTYSGTASSGSITGWTGSGTGTYNDGSVKFDSSGDSYTKTNIWSGTVSTNMTSISVTLNYKMNGSNSMTGNVFTVAAVNSSGTIKASTTFTPNATSASDKTVSLTIPANSAVTGLKLTYTTKVNRNVGLYSVSATATYTAASCSTKPALNGAANNGSVSSSSIPVKCTGITSIGANCSLTSYGFVWAPTATTTTPTLSNSNHEVGTSIATSTEFSYTITGLNASTSYTIRSYATNGNGTQYGSAYTVTTLAACTAAPTVGAGSSSNVTKNSATVTCSAGITSLGTGGCAIESYGFVIGSSANPSIGGSGVTQHEVGTSYTTTGTSFYKDLTGLTEGHTYYVRPYATNGSGTAYGDQVTFGTPKITVVPAGLVVAFGDKKVGGTYTATFTVSGVNLQGNITITPNASCSGFFSVDKTSITPDNGTVTNEEITITYTPTTAGSHGGTAYINVESTNAQMRSVMPTGTGKWEVTWNNNGSTSTTLVANNEKPTFPSTPSACDATSTTFYGWATAPWSGKLPSLAGKTVHTSNSTMDAVTANGTIYYAVFAQASGSGSATYKKVTSGLSDYSGQYLIVFETDNICFDGSRSTGQSNINLDASGNFKSVEISTTSNPYSIASTSTIDTYSFTISASQTSGKYYIQSASGYYIGSTNTDNTSTGSNELLISTSTTYNNSISVSSGNATITGANNILKCFKQSGQSDRFRYFKTTAGNVNPIQLYKYDPGITYSNYMTTCCENKVTLNSGSPSNGTVAFSPTGPIATCSSTASERQTTVTVTPNTGYKLTGWTKAVSGIALPDSTSAISTSSGNTAAQSNTYTFAQNANGSMTVTATFTAMIDHFIDKLHNKTGYTESDNHAESGVYTVPNPGDASTPSPGDDSCEDVHYKFVGWAPSSDVNPSTGAVTSTANMIYGGTTGHAASDVTYWAVWAKEE